MYSVHCILYTIRVYCRLQLRLSGAGDGFDNIYGDSLQCTLYIVQCTARHKRCVVKCTYIEKLSVTYNYVKVSRDVI